MARISQKALREKFEAWFIDHVATTCNNPDYPSSRADQEAMARSMLVRRGKNYAYDFVQSHYTGFVGGYQAKDQ